MLESRVQGAQTHLTIPTKKFFNKLSILINLIFLLEHAKNQTISSFCCRDTVNFKILKSSWLVTFFLVSGTKFFPDIGFMQDNRIITKFFNKFKNPHFVTFLANFLILLRFSFLRRFGAFEAQLLSNPMPKVRKNRSNSKKMSGGMDR